MLKNLFKWSGFTALELGFTLVGTFGTFLAIGAGQEAMKAHISEGNFEVVGVSPSAVESDKQATESWKYCGGGVAIAAASFWVAGKCYWKGMRELDQLFEKAFA